MNTALPSITNRLLEDLVALCRPLAAQGATASYIPELQHVRPDLLGICVDDGKKRHMAGDCRQRFTIQSISKVLIFTCALLDNGIDNLLQKVSVEPTSTDFDSILPLEVQNLNRPLNPMINAGAIACTTLLRGSHPGEKLELLLQFTRRICANPHIDVNRQVYLSEKQHAARNRALAYYMKSTGVISGDVEDLLETYFKACSIEMDCLDLAALALAYARDGRRPGGGGFFTAQIARTVKAVMTLCGMYNESGRVAVEVRLPCKSGVGGGILSLVPGQLGIGVFGPALGAKGTSVAGLSLLQRLSDEMQFSIF